MLEVNGKTVPTCDEGYLLDPTDWDETVAQALAQRDGLELTDLHWRVLKFIRDYYDEHGVAVDARFVIKYLDESLGLGRKGRATLYQLFPYGYAQQTCKIAGMRRPRAWSTG